MLLLRSTVHETGDPLAEVKVLDLTGSMQDMEGYLMSQLVGVVQAGPIFWVDTRGSRQRKVAASAIVDASFPNIPPFSALILCNLTTLPPSRLSSERAITGPLLLFLGPAGNPPRRLFPPDLQLACPKPIPPHVSSYVRWTQEHTQVLDFTPKRKSAVDAALGTRHPPLVSAMNRIISVKNRSMIF